MEFDTWIGEQLQQIGLDEAVFAPYITSILDEDDDLTDDDRAEAVKSLLAEACTDDDRCSALSEEVIRRWKASRAAVAQKTTAAISGALKVDLVQQLAGITASHQSAYDKAASSNSKSSYQPDSALKAAVLAQYDSAAADEEQGEEAAGEEVGSEDEERNANAEAVAKADAEKREKARAAAAEKKQKDKDDREKQKKGAEDRKKKAQEKAAKGERRK